MELSFREKKIAPERKRHILILLCIFVAALIFFEIVLNYEKESSVSAMEDARLPVVTMEACGRNMNELHGYVKKMDACYMRDAIIPLGEDRRLPITIHTYGYDVAKASYEIRSLDTERKIAETTLSDLQKDGDQLTASPQIESLIDAGEEYLLILTLTGKDGQEIYYYTRIMLPENCHEKECLEFATYFHDTALSGNYSSLSSYLETDADTNMNTLSEVTIKSGIDQVGWKNFNGSVVGEPVVEMKDINTSYVSLVFYYQVMRTDEAGSTHRYQVEEYFKVRYSAERMYLLDYSRTMEEYLNQSHLQDDAEGLSLGITGSNLSYLSNETGSIVSFVQAGELYVYHRDNSELTKVFSFIDGNPDDARANYREHDIRILNMDESGNIDFVVYGYMNRGDHEGECGIDLYHYDSSTHQAEEEIFVATTSSYQILKAGFSELIYKTSSGNFYIMMGGSLLEVDLKTLKTEELLYGMTQDQYAVSDSGRRIAWMEESGMSPQLTVLDLETEKSTVIKAPEGQLIRPLAFLDEDFVYGLSYSTDVTKDSAGSAVYPMYQLRIADTTSIDKDTDTFPLVKEYQKNGCYIMSVYRQDYTLFLGRAQKSGNSYISIDNDTIKNSSGISAAPVNLTFRSDAVSGQISILRMSGSSENANSFSSKKAGLIPAGPAKSILADLASRTETYYVYVGSRVTLATDRLSEAVIAADSDMGIVIDSKQQYLWKRGKKSSRSPLTGLAVGSLDASSNASAGCLSAMLVREGVNAEVHQLLDQGDSPYSILKSTLKDKTVLNLTGCSLSQVLYYVSQGSPVYARTGTDEAVVIIGYDTSSITVFDGNTHKNRRISMQEATSLFNNAGNIFISYIGK